VTELREEREQRERLDRELSRLGKIFYEREHKRKRRKSIWGGITIGLLLPMIILSLEIIGYLWLISTNTIGSTPIIRAIRNFVILGSIFLWVHYFHKWASRDEVIAPSKLFIWISRLRNLIFGAVGIGVFVTAISEIFNSLP
jgi:hypothetical protein